MSSQKSHSDPAAEARYRATLASIGDGVISTDAQGRVDFMNPVAERLTGWNEAEAKGRPTAEVFEIVNEETRARVECPVARVLREGIVVGLANHTLLIAKDGTERPVADSGAPIRDGDGQIRGAVLVFRDQTVERRRDRELREAEERFRAFFDNAPIGKSMTAPDGRLLRVNPAFAAMLGYSLEEVQEVSFAAITHPDDIAESRECVRALLAGERDTWLMEKRYLAKDGGIVWTSVATRLQRDPGGKPLYFLTHIQDITERKRAEAELRASENRYRTLADSLPHLVWTCRADGPCDYLSPRWVEYTGVPEAEQLGYRWLEQVHPDDRQRVIAEWSEVAPRGGAFDIEFRIRRADGVHRWFKTRAIPFRDHDGRVVKWFGSNTDIDDVKRATEEVRVLNAVLEQRIAERTTELQRSKELLDQTGRLARVGGWEIDVARNELTWTDVVRQIHEVEPGYRPTIEAGIGFYAPEAVPVISEAVRRAIEEGQPFDVELQLITAKKNRLWVRALGEATRENGEVTLVRGVFQDIHARKLAELGLQEYREHLEESNKELEAFSYSVSHDLRAPLRAIDGFARILSDDHAPHLDDEGKRVCAIIRDNTSKMGRLIDDLLTFSRLGRTEMQPSEIDMRGMARAVYHELTTPEDRARIDLRLEAMPTVVGDPSLMRQVWMNLLGNAVKFSSKRERIVITVRGETRDGEEVFSIRDNGAGFEMQYVGKLFGVFQRLHSAREFEGTGVGLALVQRVIRRHGGRVWAEGEPDRGATFHFALPQKGT